MPSFTVRLVFCFVKALQAFNRPDFLAVQLQFSTFVSSVVIRSNFEAMLQVISRSYVIVLLQKRLSVLDHEYKSSHSNTIQGLL